jgi:hypothetical protein
MWLLGDGIDPYDIANSQRNIAAMAKPLTADESAFINETMAKVASGEITPQQIQAERNLVAFSHRKADELRAIGERMGYLYDPVNKNKYFTDDELVAKGAVPSRSHYITHNINQTIDELQMKKDRRTGDAQNFFARKVGTDINIDEMIQRQDIREGLVQNWDLSFKSMIGHESYLYNMETAFESTKELAKQFDRLRNPLLQDTEKGDIERYLFGGADQPAGGLINFSVRGYKGPGEKVADVISTPGRFIVDKGIDLLNAPLEKYNTIFRVPQMAKDFRTISNYYKRYTYGMAMGLNPPSVVKNSFQSLLTLPVIGTRASLEGYRALWFAKDILKKSNVMLERGFNTHELNVSEFSVIEKVNSAPFRFGEQYMNVAPAYLGSLWKAITKDSKNMQLLQNNYGVSGKSGKSFWDGVDRAMNDGHFRAESRVADYVAELTQFSYSTWSLPKAMWSPQSKVFAQFMTWPVNYWGTYLPIMASWLWKGEGPFGKMNWWQRSAILKHVVIAEGIALLGQSQGIDLGFISPIHPVINAIQNSKEGQVSNPISSPWITGFAPLANGVQSVIQDVGFPIGKGQMPTAQQWLMPARKAFLFNARPKTVPEAIIPGSLGRNIVGIAEGDKELEALLGVGLGKNNSGADRRTRQPRR